VRDIYQVFVWSVYFGLIVFILFHCFGDINRLLMTLVRGSQDTECWK
jgi:hypothetical protein